MIWTIGYGLTEGVYEGMRLSESDAETALRREMAKHERAIVRLVTVPLSQPQFDALVSFSYNVGSGALGRSTLLRKLNAGNYKGAQGSFAAWRMAGGKVYRGLVRRRAAEAALFGADPIILNPDVIEDQPVPSIEESGCLEISKPQIVEEVDTASVKKALAGSRKDRTAKAAQNTTLVGGAAWGSWEAAKLYMGEASTGAGMVKGLMTEFGWVAALGLGLLVYTVVGYFREMMRDDVKTGKYQPTEEPE
tara:strand:- start:885 stop:1631 length:747 start_codon:yes stop_codon:yes gene_type:complete